MKKKAKTKLEKSDEKKEDHVGIVGDLEGKLARALADYDNLRKRVEREKDTFFHVANKGLIGRFLVIYDMLISAQEHINDSGIAIITEEFKRLLADEGVEQIKVENGDKFDESVMEAVETEPGNDKNNGKVAGVLLSGWKLREGIIIREAKVKVYKHE
jgi:molecular chaperone GrpE